MRVNELKFDEVKENEKGLVNFQNQLLGKQFRNVLGDLHYLQHVYAEDLMNSENVDQIADDWLEFSNQRQFYDQIRFINADGDEVIRINYDDKQAWRVNELELQNKKERYYFYETKTLDDEDVFVSPLDLNIENDEIERPFKPMIRFSTPLHNETNEFQGALVLNYLGKPLLDDFREIADTSKGSIALLNADSYWLSCENSNNEWNFMFEEKTEQMFSTSYPNEWEIIKQGPDQILTKNGLFTFAPVHLNHHYTKGDDYATDDQVKYLDSTWYIVSVVPPEAEAAPYFLGSPIGTMKKMIQKNSYQFLFILVISIIVGYLVYLNRKNYYRIKFYSEYDPLTKSYNRRAGLTKLHKKMNKNERKKVSFSLCFIDVNGLKQVNDHLGHDAGDELLTIVAETVKANIRESDFLIRQGGDEFIIIFDGIGITAAEKIWNRIVAQFEAINVSINLPYRVSVSHGIVEYKNNDKIEIDDLIQLADDKMYQEKEIINKQGSVLK